MVRRIVQIMFSPLIGFILLALLIGELISWTIDDPCWEGWKRSELYSFWRRLKSL